MRFGISRRLLNVGMALVVFGLGGAHAPSRAETDLRPVELYFEAKLLFRDRVMLQRVAVDQWAGGKLSMLARPLGPGTIFELVRPLDDPWTFRWYPAKHEVKLGAAVAVAEPSGHPYGSLAGKLTEDAGRRYESWWKDDIVLPTAPRQPAWQEEVEHFWAQRHAEEEKIKDPLHRHPVYPFYVLGDPSGRLGFVVGADGGVIGDSVTERMSEPWLADGWDAWQRGERRAGYGYWEPERPGWEPNTYQAFAAALSLLAWSPLKGGDAASTFAFDAAGGGYTITAVDLPGVVARFFETLNPLFLDRIDWSDRPSVRFTVVEKSPGALVIVGNAAETPVENARAVRYRVWRYARYDKTVGRLTHDEIQVYAAHRNAGIKAWIKIGYRPYAP